MRDDRSTIFRFGTFVLDGATGDLRRNGRPVVIQEQPLNVLIALLERPGEIVDRATLRQRLWPEDFHVDAESGINAAVGRLRDALGDAAANPRFIATVPRRGYRFIAPVSRDSVETGAAEPTPPRRVPSSRPWAVGVSIGLALSSVLAIVGIMHLRGSASEPVDEVQATEVPVTAAPVTAAPVEKEPRNEIRLAVLPFTDLGAPRDGALLGDGLTAELISVLGRLAPDRLRVIALTSVSGFRGQEVDLEAVGRRLDVDFVLEGTVRQEADVARVTVALVAVDDQTSRWSATYDRDATSLIALEREIAAEVAGTLALTFDVESTVSLPAGRAGELVLRGRALLERRTEDGFRQALRSFEAAVAEDPTAASAYAGMAGAWSLLGVWDHAPRERAYPAARQWAERALQLDPSAAEAHLVMAAVEFLYAWRFDRASERFDRALALNPSDAHAQAFAAEFWVSQGEPARATAALERALSLDPLSPSLRSRACWLLYVLGRVDEALMSCQRAIDFDADYLGAWDNVKWIHILEGDEAEAIEAFLRVVALEEIHALEVDALRAVARDGGIKGLLRASLHSPSDRLGESGQSPYNLALDHASLGDVESALDWLEKAFAARETDLVNLGVDPRLDPLRDHPRFESLLRRVGLR